LPKYLGRNYDMLNLSVTSVTALKMTGDGLVPTVTGVAKNLQGLKRPGVNYAVILLGVNDIGLSSATLQQVIGYLQTLCAQCAAAGWLPVLIAEMATTSSTGTNASILLPPLRAAIMAQGAAGMNAYAIVDLYGYVPVTTPANTAYYYDGLHPTPAVQQIIASAIAQVIPTP
jgi:lysophospholipase L1-like esterase